MCPPASFLHSVRWSRQSLGNEELICKWGTIPTFHHPPENPTGQLICVKHLAEGGLGKKGEPPPFHGSVSRSHDFGMTAGQHLQSRR